MGCSPTQSIKSLNNREHVGYIYFFLWMEKNAIYTYVSVAQSSDDQTFVFLSPCDHAIPSTLILITWSLQNGGPYQISCLVPHSFTQLPPLIIWPFDWTLYGVKLPLHIKIIFSSRLLIASLLHLGYLNLVRFLNYQGHTGLFSWTPFEAMTGHLSFIDGLLVEVSGVFLSST